MSIDLLKHNFDAYRAAILMLNSTVALKVLCIDSIAG